MPIYKMKGSKDGKQKYRVRINYQDASGNNRQIDRVAYGNSEAKDLERRLLYEIKAEIPAARLTLNDLYNEYIASKKNEVRESTLEKSKEILNKYVLKPLGADQLKKLNTQILNKWKLYIENIQTKKGAPLSLKMRQNIYSEFRTLLNFGVKMSYISKNPLTAVGNFKSTLTPQKEMNYYTADEFKLFIAAAREDAENSSDLAEWDYYVFFCIAFYTGLRKGEIHALKWSDIDGEYLKVTRSITQKLKGEDRETAPKNKSSIRTLQMPIPLINILTEHKARYKQFEGFNDDFRICGGIRPLRDTSLQNKNKKYAKEAGVKTIRIHDFRHSHVSLLANEGINIQEIARRLGHSDVTMTWNTYSHLYPREEERAVNILNKIV